MAGIEQEIFLGWGERRKKMQPQLEVQNWLAHEKQRIGKGVGNWSNCWWEYNSMLTQINIQIASKLTELILQARIDVKKALFTHLENTFKSIKSLNYQPSSVSQLLMALIPKDSYKVTQKLSKSQVSKSSAISVQIMITLSDKTTGRRIDAEHWCICISRKRGENGKESIGMVVQFFQEALLMLNKLPLFSVYQKDKQLKARYCLDYKVLFDYDKYLSIFDLRGQHFLQRQNEALKLYAKVAYRPSLDGLTPKTQFSDPSKRKQSSSSDYNTEKKVSVYAFYDPELNFTFLSSDEQNFKKKGESEQIQMQMEHHYHHHEQTSQEFQLLIANEDDEFLQETKDWFQLLSKIEKEYLLK